jgi:hypothetical protein
MVSSVVYLDVLEEFNDNPVKLTNAPAGDDIDAGFMAILQENMGKLLQGEELDEDAITDALKTSAETLRSNPPAVSLFC